MVYFFLASICFILFIFSHVVTYRLGIICFENWKLILLALIWSIFYLLLAFKTNLLAFSVVKLEWSSYVCYWLFILWYIGEMTTIQYSSPSMKILKALLRHPEKRIRTQDVQSLFTDQEFIIDRLDDLVLNDHVKKDGSLYFIQPRGKLIAAVFKIYRAILGRSLGG